MNPKALRIAHFLINLEVGGAEIVVLNLCRWQKEHGHSPSVHSLFGLGPLSDRFRDAGIPIVTYRKAGPLGMMRQIWDQLRKEQTDVVHTNNVSPTIHASIPAKLAGVPVVVATRHMDRSYGRKAEIQFSLAAKFCQAVVGVSDATSDLVRQQPFATPSRVKTIYNGSAPALSNNEQIATDGFTLINVARLYPQKDQATLIRAFALALKTMSDLRLWILGTGPLQASLESLARELNVASEVVFWQGRANVADYLAASQVFILSSIAEGLPMAALEAMAAGIPIITTEVGQTPEMIRRFQNGFVVPPSSPEQLASAIIAAASDARRLKAMGEASRKAYLAEFTNDHMNEAYLALYTQARAS